MSLEKLSRSTVDILPTTPLHKQLRYNPIKKSQNTSKSKIAYSFSNTRLTRSKTLPNNSIHTEEPLKTKSKVVKKKVTATKPKNSVSKVNTSKPITKARSESYGGKTIKQINKKQNIVKSKTKEKNEPIPPPPVDIRPTSIALPEVEIEEKTKETLNEENEYNEKDENMNNVNENDNEKNDDNENNGDDNQEKNDDIPPPPSIEEEDNSDKLPELSNESPVESPKEIEEPLYPNAIYFPTIPSKVMNILVNYMTDVQQKKDLLESKYLTEEEIDSPFLWDLIVVADYLQLDMIITHLLSLLLPYLTSSKFMNYDLQYQLQLLDLINEPKLFYECLSCLLPLKYYGTIREPIIRIGILSLIKRKELYLEESDDILKYQKWEPDICRWSPPYKDIDNYFDNENYEEMIADISSQYVDTYLTLLESIMNDNPYPKSEDLCLFSLYGGIDLLNISFFEYIAIK